MHLQGGLAGTRVNHCSVLCAAPSLPGGSQLQHGCQLTEVNHEGGLRHADRVLAGNASEDAVSQANGGFCGGYKGAHMGQEDYQRHLLCVAAFA